MKKLPSMKITVIRVFLEILIPHISIGALASPGGGGGSSSEVMRSEGDRIRAIAISPDGRRGASTGMFDGKVQLWDLLDKTLIGEFPSSRTTYLQFSEDSRSVYFMDHDRPILYQYNISDKKAIEVVHFQLPSDYYHDAAINLRNHQAIVSNVNDVFLVDLTDGSASMRPDLFPRSYHLSLSSDAKWALLFSWSQSTVPGKKDIGRIQIWNRIEDRIADEFVAQDSKINSAVFSPGNDQFATASGGKYLDPSISKTEWQYSDDNSLCVWDTATRQRLYRFDNFDKIEGVSRINWSPDGRLLIVASGSIVHVFDIKKGIEFYQYNGHQAKVSSLQVAPDGRSVLSGDERGCLRYWMIPDALIMKQDGAVREIDVSSDEKVVATTGAESGLYLWELETGRLIRKIQTSGVARARFCPDNDHVLIAERDACSIRRISISNDNESTVTLLKIPEKSYDKISLNAAHNRAVVRTKQSAVLLMDLATGEAIRNLNAPGMPEDAELSPDANSALIWQRMAVEGQKIAYNTKFNMWDIEQDKEMSFFSINYETINQVTFSRDGQYEVLCNGGSLRDPSTGFEQRDPLNTLALIKSIKSEYVYVFFRKKDPFLSADFSPDGKIIMASSSMNVAFFDTQRKEELYRYTGHSATVTSVKYTPRGDRAITGDSSGEIRCWSIPKWQK